MKENRIRMSRQERQAQILKVAMEIFVDNGYKGTTTAQIAEAAGISEVTLFRNFDSKREIFLQGVIPILTETLEESLTIEDSETPQKALERFLEDRLSVISENHGVVRLILMENQMNHELSDIDFIKTIGDLIQNGLERIGFKIINEDFTIRLIMGSILSFLFLPARDECAVKEFAGRLANMIDATSKTREV
ncbi:TetR/AcrR family transcriptional regulator [Gudongella sp. DL1XJH-153]|uniref:TetR/AcrR family transcriptional regulator n=1 Tax=Gudongella sp. DL1XJH-153 TaxID=3409804 RepID=UPI003BB59A6C